MTLVLLPPIADVTAHNARLERLAGAFKAVSHPYGTAEVLRLKTVGNLEGTGNQCSYFIASVRTFTGDPSVLRRHYETQRPADPNRSGPLHLHLAFIHDGRLDDAGELPVSFREIEAWPPRVRDGRDLCVVFLYEGGDESGFDCRCQ